MSWEVAACYPTARARRYEDERPELADLLPHVEALEALSPPYWRSWWENVAESTEAA
jgi:hypothetical protein